LFNFKFISIFPAKKPLKKNKIFKQHVMREYILKCSGLEMWTAES